MYYLPCCLLHIFVFVHINQLIIFPAFLPYILSASYFLKPPISFCSLFFYLTYFLFSFLPSYSSFHPTFLPTFVSYFRLPFFLFFQILFSYHFIIFHNFLSFLPCSQLSPISFSISLFLPPSPSSFHILSLHSHHLFLTQSSYLKNLPHFCDSFYL